MSFDILKVPAYIYCLLCLISCSTTKYISDGEYLLDKVKIDSDNADVNASALNPYLQQHPNYKIFGLFKWPLYVYNWSGSNDEKWLNRQLKRLGEPPVKLDYNLAEQSKTEMNRYLYNRGYTNARIDMQIDTVGPKKAVLNYSVTAGEPFRVSSYTSSVEDMLIDSIIHLNPPRRTFFQSLFRPEQRDYTSYIEDDMLFDRNILNKERQRLTTLLRRNGYYAFNRDYIGYLADSSSQRKAVDLYMQIKARQYVSAEGETEERPHRRYYINSVKILTDYDPLDPDMTGTGYTITDSAASRGINIYYGPGGRNIRPDVLQQSCYITPGELYSERSLEQTYRSFAALKALRYVSVKFDELEKADTMKLDCTILTAPAKKQGIRFDVEGTNSSGDFGFAASMMYQHRNLFKGSELFSAKIRGGYEYLSQSQSRGNYWEFAGETSLHFPHFLFPFIGYDFRRRMRATTEFQMSYDQQRRPEYHRSTLSAGWIYHWQQRGNAPARHTFKLLDINYVFLPYIDQDFKGLLPETTALYNYSNQFVVSTGYVYSFNNYNPVEQRKNTYSFRFALESAGNLMSLVSDLSGAKKNEKGRYELFGIDYSQFLKTDIDFARSFTIDPRNSIAFHVGAGIAYPFGNTREIPFELRYYSGGANNNRGWSVRTLGPGSMPVTDSTSFVNQVGDVHLDANIEYRSRLFWKFELACFIDAGNIWTLHQYDYQPFGNFDLERFYKEIAVSWGLGLRLDFDYFLVRFDMGLKAYNPQEKGRKKWAITSPDFKHNFAWHFAVGYPF